jgi:hypothetical protein
MDTVELRMKYVKHLNWSLLRAGVPLVHEFEVTNGAPAPHLNFSIGLEPYIKTLNLPANNLAAYKTRLPEFQVNWDKIWGVSGKHDLIVEFNGYKAEFEIEVLPPEAWHHSISWAALKNKYAIENDLDIAEGKVLIPPGGNANLKPTNLTWANPPLPVCFSALVQSQLDLVEEIKDSIVARLREPNGPPLSITRYHAAMRPLLKALFEELRERYPNLYHDIPRQSLQQNTQSLRLAFDDVWNAGKRGRGATCIDLVVFGAAILEACGARPGLVIIGNGDGSAHALLSCWIRSDETVRKPLITEETDFEIYISGERPELLVLDLTQLTTGSMFEDALEKGQRYLRTSGLHRFVYMVDIYETRYPPSSY